jgi:hypothetical protein
MVISNALEGISQLKKSVGNGGGGSETPPADESDTENSDSSDTAVNPNLPGTDPASGGPNAGGERQMPGDPVQEITGRPEPEGEPTSEVIDPSTGIRGEGSLETESQQNWGLLGQEEQIDISDEASEYPPEPQLEDFQTGMDENGDPIYDHEAYNQAMAEWQTNVDAIALKVGEEPPYFPVNLDLHSESDMRDYYQGVLNKIAHAKSVLHNEIENWPDDGDHSFTLNIPFKVSDRPLLYVDSYRTISSIEEAQHALDSWNFDDLKYMEDQLVPK